MRPLHPLRAADLMLRQHGAAAAARAEERRQMLLSRGDANGAAGWLQVIDAIRELERTAPRTGESVH